MSASPSDKITDTRNGGRPNSARATGTRSAGGTSLNCNNLTGWPDTTKSLVFFVTYKLDTTGKVILGTQLDCHGIVSGNSLSSIVVDDGNDTGNAIGDVVEMLPTAAWGQGLATALTKQHDRQGNHVGINNTGGLTSDTATINGTSTLVNLILNGTLTGSGLGNQLTTYSNPGSAGGSYSYINIAGIKLFYGQTAAIATGGTYDITFPPAFFSAIKAGFLTAGPVSGTNEVTTTWQSAGLSTTTGTVVIDAVAGSGSMPVNVLVLGS